MVDEEFLAHAIDVAVDRGWETWSHRTGWEVLELHHTETGVLCWEAIVYNWGFAQAIWPSEQPDLEMKASHGKHLWQYHLQMMVICPDPIAYLANNLT